MFGDEASFWLDGTLHRTWARIGQQPHVDTFGARKTAHVFGALSLEAAPAFHYLFASVFNSATFLDFLKKLVRYSRRKIFLIIDNGPCHCAASAESRLHRLAAKAEPRSPCPRSPDVI